MDNQYVVAYDTDIRERLLASVHADEIADRSTHRPRTEAAALSLRAKYILAKFYKYLYFTN